MAQALRRPRETKPAVRKANNPAARNVNTPAVQKMRAPVTSNKNLKTSKKRSISERQHRRMPDLDYTFLFMVILMVCTGLIMLLSASAPTANVKFGDSYYFFKRQFGCVLVGLVGMYVISRIDYRKYKKYVPAFMIVCTILLGLVLIPGIGVKLNGSRRWLPFPGTLLQPSEFMKLAIGMFFALLIDQKIYEVNRFDTKKGIWPFLIWILITDALMLGETHLSGAIVITGIAITVMIAGGAKVKPFAIAGAVALPIGVGAVYALSPVRWERIISFLNPFADIRDTGYQVAQGLYAIGSGGIFGLGLGQSVQKYSYLPEPYNDFIFAIVCEELGLIGAVLIIALFALLVIRGIRVALNAPDTYSSLVVIGIMAQIVIQTTLNIAVATSSVPNTGVALPFFSYGGTAIIVLLLEMGIVLNISRYSMKKTL